MTPGPLIIRKCSVCGKLIAQHTTGSGNTIGARFWTDGKMDAPMLPDRPRLVKCQHCGALVWINDQEKLAEIDFWRTGEEIPPEFSDARPGATPSMEDYLASLAEGVSDRQKEHYLRLRVWWAGNDRRRGNEKELPMSSQEIANLRAFAQILDEAEENERLMKAEVLRELGLFGKARALLGKPFSEELSEAVATIRQLTEQKSTLVMEIKYS